MTVRVRIAPSPTGDPHVGTAYIALFNYVFAKKNGGKFVLRIEDTDQTRARADSEQMIFDALRWTGLQWDEGPDVGGPFGPYRQSERTELYRKHTHELVQRGEAYPCFCTADRLAKMRIQQQTEKRAHIGYDRRCRDIAPAEAQQRIAAGEEHVIRLKMPLTGEIVVNDLLREPIRIDAETVDDQVLLKSDGFPTYHLANVVDDHLMEITHVIRAEEWITSTPKHVALYKAFGWTAPQWIHMPLLRNADKSKISKRKNPVSINYYRDSGILPNALLNYLGQMGWSFGNDREKYTLAEMIDVFSWERMSIGGPVFDLAKLKALNQSYLQALDDDGYAQALVHWRLNPAALRRIAPLVRDRAKTLTDVLPLTEYLFSGDLELEPVKAKLAIAGVEAGKLSEALLDFVERFEARTGFTKEMLEEVAKEWAGANGWKPKQCYPILRIALTARDQTPGLFDIMAVLGKELTRRRLRLAAEVIART